jgi:hypothetical protein
MKNESNTFYKWTATFRTHSTNPVLNKEEVLRQWGSIIVPIYKKGDKLDYSNYRGVSLLSTAFRLFSNGFLWSEIRM